MQRIARILCLTGLIGLIVTISSASLQAAGFSNSIFLPILTQGSGTTGPVGPFTGNSSDPVSAAIPNTPYIAQQTDYTPNHPDLGDTYVAYNVLLIAFELNTTIAEANTILSDIDATIVGGMQGVAGQASGWVIVKLPTTSHTQLEAIVNTLAANPNILYVEMDALLGTTELPNTGSSTPSSWSWGATPGGGNWGLERIGAPQMWNLNAAIEKAGNRSDVGVLDTGFSATHPDLSYTQVFTGNSADDHGTHVAGTIGATYSNGTGVDGVNPFANLYVKMLDPNPTPWTDVYAGRVGWGTIMTTGIVDLITTQPSIKVINTSLGYNWAASNIGIDTTPRAQRMASQHGGIFGLTQLVLVIRGYDLPIISAAAGNDSNIGFGVQSARFASPYTNAALEYNMANIIVVEAVANSATSAGGATRSTFSQTNGHISAPGTGILSTSFNGSNIYETFDGTSMAAPHVTGLISYLYALDPSLPRATMTANPILDILQANDIPVAGGAANRIDAFASAMQLDSYNFNDNVRKMLTDIDDGSADGNQRIAPLSGFDYTVEDFDGDGGSGDGTVDMSDFRRWRDWLLQLEDSPSLTLDGTAMMLKKDVNGNGAVGFAAAESVYPRGDFNGDGMLDRATTAAVPGRFPGNHTDLSVLQSVFSDDNYNSGDLPNLIDSGDVTIQPFDCFPLSDATVVRSRVYGANSEFSSAWREHTDRFHRQVYTLPAADFYILEMVALDSTGTQTHSAIGTATTALGSDFWWNPNCTPLVDNPPTITITSPATDHTGSADGFVYDGYDSTLNLDYSDVTLQATASDSEDGTLSGMSITWTTDRTDIQSGTLGTGSTLGVRMYSDDCFGAWHTVTATVTDSSGNTAFDTRQIFLWTLC